MSAAVLSLLLADSRTPSGGYAHSGGLEAAVAAGLGVDGVQPFAAARLATVARVDAAFAAAAAAVDVPSSASLGETQTTAHPLAALLRLDEELAARVASAPQRAAARGLGRALLRVGGRLWPGDALLAAYARESAWTPRPVAFGALARAAGLSPLEAARLVLYEDAAGIAAAAVKLLPLDAVDATAWVAELAPRIDALAGEAAGHAALPASSTPLLDLRSLDHDRSDGRLFVT